MKKIIRRHFLVKKHFQFWYMGTILVMMFFVSALIGYVILLAVISALADESSVTYALIRNLLWSIPLIGIIVAVVSIFLSHRIAGPMYRFETDLDKIAQGDLTVEIRSRKNDQMGSLKEKLNELASKFRETILKQRDCVEEIVKALESLKRGSSSSSSPEEKKEAIERLAKAVNQAKELISSFKV